MGIRRARTYVGSRTELLNIENPSMGGSTHINMVARCEVVEPGITRGEPSSASVYSPEGSPKSISK